MKLFSCSILIFISMLFGNFSVSAQNPSKIITGTVVDTNGQPLIGATVALKGTKVVTITDYNGNFSLNVGDVKNSTLIISSIGYTSIELTPENLTDVRVELKESTEQLDEVVVVGYGTQRKKDLTGSVAVIKSDEIASLPVPSISDAMQGRAAGVQVITSGQPGNDATFRIRGTGTINDSNPLLVIDGVPVSGGLNQLNMNDVESLQVLKDASATAIYGSQGANGVVIITTKRGINKNGISHLNFNYSYGVQKTTNMIEMLNASQFAQLHNEMMTNAGKLTNPAYADPQSLGAGSDWLGAFFCTAPMQNYSLSYSNGNEKSNLYVSGNLLNQDGIIINTGFKRLTFQLNSDTKITDFLRFGNNLTLNHDIKTSGDYNVKNAMLALPTQPIMHEDGTYSGPVAQPEFDGDIVNPIGLAKTVDKATKGYNLMGSVYGEIDLYKGLKFKSTAGVQLNLWDSRTWAPKYAWDTSVNENSYLWQQANKNITWLLDNLLTYDQSFDLHHLNVMLGTSAQENRYNYISGSVQNFASDLTQQLDNGTAQQIVKGNTSSYSLFSLMGRVNYNYADKYYITTTLRRDGSSRFGENNKYGLFPSVSLAWRISQESFFKPLTFVDDLKLRVGYGVTGNQNIGNYTFSSSLNTYVYNFNNTIVSTVIPTVMPNPFIQWEQQKQTNAGFDASLLGQRVNIILDAYIKNTDKMLVPMAVPVTTGYSDIYVPSINAGKMENKGIELTVSTKNLNKEFKWNTDFNISFNRNKVVSINDTVPMYTGSIGLNYNLALIKAGLPINEFYGFVTDGIFQTQEEVDNHAVQVAGNDPYNRTSAGDIRFKDLNNDGVINDKDRTYLGSPNPTVIYSMNNYFEYKSFDLSVFLQGVAGNKIFNANRLWSEAMAVAQNQTVATLDRWTGEGTSNTIPRAVFNDPNKNTRQSDRYIEDGAYLRLKNITLGYKVPSSTLKKIKLSQARLYFSVQNVLTFTKYTGFDPEVGVSGIDNNVYPVNRTFTFGINLGI
ncbi:SusC-like TonB-dependent receptor [uncultured Paludibacter sp.]|uniref:SusC-like TonB-dependent receptor n=1 Tax=uncultured Paludibacter sp. TaxID=497635 RepID=A0A653AKZ1_9BACT|nr:SusC-like TonB-dependent receptor [uncultured Paludibacter sp.]